MNEIRLELPNIKYYKSYVEAMKEFQSYGNKLRAADKGYDDFEMDISEKDFEEKIVNFLLDYSNLINLAGTMVPSTEFWIIDKDGYVGSIRLRHKLNEKLKKSGGHIGYDVRPSKRGNGYSKIALRMCLEKAYEMGITEVMITCDETNEASKRTIIGALNEYGGKEDGFYKNDETGVKTLHFWINTRKF